MYVCVGEREREREREGTYIRDGMIKARDKKRNHNYEKRHKFWFEKEDFKRTKNQKMWKAKNIERKTNT